MAGANTSVSFPQTTVTLRASPAIPGAPNCSTYASVPACMASVVVNLAPTAAGTSFYGYQAPSATSVYDPLFPQWLCSVTNLPANLVTMGCVVGDEMVGKWH